MSLFLGLSSFVAAAASSGASCTPIAGWEQVLADERARWIVIGEMHGNNETPAIFADAVCLAAQVRGPVVVALELPSREQAAIDRFMASDGGEAARRALLEGPHWNSPAKDGRSSQAYFRLLETLRQLRATHRIASVVAFQPSEPLASPEAYEKAMAATVQAAGGADATVLALVGNVHAMRTKVSFQGGYLPMAAHLPPGRTLTFNAPGEGGKSWACMGNPVTCGPQSLGTYRPRTRGVELIPGDEAPYSGALYLGVPTTASPPQVPAVE